MSVNIEVHSSRCVMWGEASTWFSEYPSIEHFLSPSDPAAAPLVGREFLAWFNIYALERRECVGICDLAERHTSCPALAWCWMLSEHFTFEVFRDLILEAARCFHAKVGLMVYSPEHCHYLMSCCVQAVEDTVDRATYHRAASAFARLHHPHYDLVDSGSVHDASSDTTYCAMSDFTSD